MNLSNEKRLLLLCARNGTAGDRLKEISSLLSLRIKWDEFLNTAVSQGMAPLAYKSLKDIPDMTAVPPEVMDRLRKTYHANVARNMYFYAELERVLRAFNERGIEVMMLKGAALAGTVYGDIGLRAMGDIDLLVKEECLPLAREIMSDLDYETQRHCKSEEWYRAKHFHLRPFIHKEKSIIVEIHWKVAQDSLGINVDKWWERAGKISLRGAPALVPSPEDMVLHICISLFHGNYKTAALRGLTDISETQRYYSGKINWDMFNDTVTRSEIARPVYSLLFLFRKYFDSGSQAHSWPGPAHADFNFTGKMEEIIFSPEGVSHDVFMRFLAAGTKWEKTKIILADLFPSREKMSEKYSVQSGSAMLYLFYAYRPFEMAVKYGGSFLKALRSGNSG